MTDEISLTRATERAARAQRLLEDELLKEALDTLDRDYTKAWRETAARDTDARERLWQACQVVAKVRDHLANVVNGGKLAQRELNDLAERQKRFGIIERGSNSIPIPHSTQSGCARTKKKPRPNS
jgi:hypothetical protein